MEKVRSGMVCLAVGGPCRMGAKARPRSVLKIINRFRTSNSEIILQSEDDSMVLRCRFYDLAG